MPERHNHIFPRPVPRLLTLFVLAASLGALVSAGAGNAAPEYVLKIEGIVETSGSGVSVPNCAILDGIACPMAATGSVGCTICVPGGPTSGSFSLSVDTLQTFPPSPCRLKGVSGVFTIAWSDGTSTTGQFEGRFRDSKPILALSGSVTASSSQYIQLALVKGVLEGFPPSPCVASSTAITGALAFSG